MQPPQVCHRLETGQSPLARTCGGTGDPRSGAPSPLLHIVHVRNLDQKVGGNLPYEMGLGTCFSERVFHARPGARRFFGQMIQKSKEKQLVSSKFCYHPGTAVFDTTYTKATRVSKVSGKFYTELADVVPTWFWKSYS